jgi:bifunctional non-homologous end joining protein LigD
MAAKSTTKGERLDEYRAKRSADQSPEPFGGEGVSRTGVFVVQKHAARRLHYDLRLEVDGVLQSFAVPQGPSLDPASKQLAVQTEDHPLEYIDFEGVIPKDNYGAGAMIVWDRGRFEWLEDPVGGMERGKLLFSLHGYKLRGTWTLVRMKRKRGDRSPEPSKEWLLIKKVDGFSRTEDAQTFAQESILSGLTVEELAEGESRAADLRGRLEQLGAERAPVEVSKLKLMLAETREEPFDSPEWLYELKWDGYRLVAARDGARARLQYRSGRDATDLFPDLERVVRALPYERFILDGEVVVLDDDGKANFQKLQRRARLENRREIVQASYDLPAILYAFDLLAFEDFDLRRLPLATRKALLRDLLPAAGPIKYCDHIEERGVAFYGLAEQRGLEGIMAKKADSTYVGRRSPDWLKLRIDRTGDFVVVGFTEPRKSRAGFGALHLATWGGEEQGFVYAGRVGTGFSDAQLIELRALLDGMRREDYPGGELPAIGGVKIQGVWVDPELVVEVRYKEVTGAGQLRHPALLRIRDDKPVEECTREGGASVADREPPPAPVIERDESVEKVVKLTNLDKVFWPDEGYTKGDLIDYYREVAPFILPYLRDRPVVLTRYPDGIEGKSFFQKDAPPHTPGWVRLERMWSENAQREIDYYVCDDEETLLLLAQLGTIPLHIWSSRVAQLAHPDWCILDLDPKDAPFENVVKIALAIRELCEHMEVECFVKTSGATGLHVLLPLGNQLTYEQSRSFAELMAKVIVHDMPDIATTTRAVGKRAGRVYIDYLQNGHGRLLVGPLSVRPRPGATVSTPLRWSEVNPKLDRWRFTIKTVPRRLHRLKEDPLLRIFDVTPDLSVALARLTERVQS